MPSLKTAIENGIRSEEEFTHIDFSGEMIQYILENEHVIGAAELFRVQHLLKTYLINTNSNGETHEN